MSHGSEVHVEPAWMTCCFMISLTIFFTLVAAYAGLWIKDFEHLTQLGIGGGMVASAALSIILYLQARKCIEAPEDAKRTTN